jgi:hypothetical protein
MSKAQTDIRTTSYDERSANPYGYQGTIEDALAQIRAEPAQPLNDVSYARHELLRFLNVTPRAVRADDEDWSVQILDAPQPENKFSLEYAFDHGFIQAPQS